MATLDEIEEYYLLELDVQRTTHEAEATTLNEKLEAFMKK